jgi:predicted SprT family Zn-dependent metalloprotease
MIVFAFLLVAVLFLTEHFLPSKKLPVRRKRRASNKHELCNKSKFLILDNRMAKVDLIRIFAEWNLKSFHGQLPVPELRWNSRLQTTAGRFTPNRRNPIIEVASYLLEEENAESLVRDTIGHEMIHYWLWVARRPYGHTSEFHQKMEEIGVSRYNPVPRHRPFKHAYVCDSCENKVLVRRKLKAAACAGCCNQYANGEYHPQFKLRWVPISTEEVPQVAIPKRA